MTADSIHREMLETIPELGTTFGFEQVLGNFGWFVWEAYLAGDEDLVRRSLDYVEWLLGAGDRELATLAVRKVFKGHAWGAVIHDWLGPRTRAELAGADWAR